MKKALVVLLLLVVTLVVIPPVLSPLLGWGPQASEIPPAGKIVEIKGGHWINVIESGSGPAIVLVHGLPGSAYDWRPLPARLAESPYRIVRYDRVGYGHSDRRGEGEEFSLETNATELLELLDALDIQRAVLVGWSYGGGVVQVAALRAPHRVSGVVLVAAIGPAFEFRRQSALQRFLRSEPVMRWGMAAGLPGRASVRQGSVEAFSSEEAIPEWWVEQVFALMAIPGTIHSWRAEGRRVDLDGPEALRPEDLRVPVLVIQGTDDRLVPVSVAEDLHGRVVGAELLMVQGGSHMLPITHPDALADRILDFVGRESG
jgi:pimeloyl-ACP methyl ester carboxylesterase